ncbi:hypothetical protein MCP1_370026 [Candidatus Terasakiella magnetica]|nr:hypothetical protein MCP1_370026 [Candidatus Terasakiella magnetica]
MGQRDSGTVLICVHVYYRVV